MFDPKNIRQDFPIFESEPSIAYLDSAATALKPKAVIEAMHRYYSEYSTNVGRGLYPLAEKATLALSEARQTVAQFVNAETEASVVFTANATHGINLVALGLEHLIDPQQNIVVTELEHHSNYLPWRELAVRTGAELRTARFTADGKIDQEHLASLVDRETAAVAFSAVSNVFGVINPSTEIIRTVRNKNRDAKVLVDACQAAGHVRIDIQGWDADYAVFSGHKLFGPTGIGVLAGKRSALELLAPMNVGGGTVLDACSPKIEYKPLPENLEGGTPNIAGAIGLAAAIKYVDALGIENIRAHETALAHYALERLAAAFGRTLHILGTDDEAERVGIISFTIDNLHPHDLAHILGEENIYVRAGEHCASPLHRAVHASATTRVSLSIYNTEADIDRLVAAMKKIHILFTSSDL